MGLKRHYPILTERMGAMLAVHGVKDSAILEFGPMGTANYYEMSCGRYGIERHEAHFAVHTTDMDISLGRYSHLIDAIKEIENDIKPKIIFIFASSIMNVIGVDVEGIIAEAGSELHTPVIVYPSTSFSNSFMNGIEDIMYRLADFAEPDKHKKQHSYAIIGSVPDDFHFQSDTEEIKRMMDRYFDAHCICSFPFSCSSDDIKNLGRAEINLVFRQEALKAAEFIKESCGIPYVFFRPYGTEECLRDIKEIENVSGWPCKNKVLYSDLERTRNLLAPYIRVLRFQHSSRFDKTVLLYGNYDTVKGMAEFLKKELGLSVLPFAKASFAEDVEIFSEDSWDILAEQHRGSVILADGEMHYIYGERSGIISSPAVKFQDLTHDRPFIGFRGALNIMQLIDDCRPQ